MWCKKKINWPNQKKRVLCRKKKLNILCFWKGFFFSLSLVSTDGIQEKFKSLRTIWWQVSCCILMKFIFMQINNVGKVEIQLVKLDPLTVAHFETSEKRIFNSLNFTWLMMLIVPNRIYEKKGCEMRNVVGFFYVKK